MSIINRTAQPTLKNLAKGYPALVITGPRQSGKTTLARTLFDNKPYTSLEEIDNREFAQNDPRGFLDQYPDGAILDEVQRCPDLFSYLQSRLDNDKRSGLFILTGSQQFGLLSGISQSLAGRVAKLSLLPFSLTELQKTKYAPKKLDTLLFNGLYPPIYDRGLEPHIWYGNYIGTYIERDVRQLITIRDLGTFQHFLRMCAARTGQVLNLSSLANDCGITHNTAKAWISILEASYVVHLLQPHHRNFNKRLIKAPKLYFYDTGLASWLLNIQNSDQVITHPMRGQLFETFVVAELLKNRFNHALASNLFFWQDSVGNEIDILVEKADKLVPIEIKSGKTLTSGYFKQLNKFTALAAENAQQPSLAYGGSPSQKRENCTIYAWDDIGTLCKNVL